MSLIINLGTLAISSLSGWQPLPDESAIAGYTHVATINFDALSDSTASDAQVFTCPITPNCRVADVLLDLKTPFANTADVTNNHTTVTVGDGESATQFVSSTELNQIGLQTFADGVTNTDTSLVSATASFTAADVGLLVTGTGIPAATTIASVTNGTTVVLSAATTATATGVSISIAGRGPVPFKAMTGTAKTYLASDTLQVAITPKTGTALTALNQGLLAVYARIIQDKQIG